jgi:hypothetical protein
MVCVAGTAPPKKNMPHGPGHREGGSTARNASASSPPDDGSKDVFAPFSAITGSGYESPDENQRVESGPTATVCHQIATGALP